MKYLALDIGNVICHVNFDNFKNKLSKTLNISTIDVDYFLNRTQRLHDMGLTEISDELRDHFKIKSSVIIDELMEEWTNTLTFNQEFLDGIEYKVNELGRKNITIALLSNIGFEHAKLMKSKWFLTSILNNPIMFFSCEVGARKPSYLYYKTFLDMHPEFKGCLYIDDRKENLETGDRFGFKPKLFSLDNDLKGKDTIQKIAIIKQLLSNI
jgi:FMN phosphatase YigB (HAD superfamily)